MKIVLTIVLTSETFLPIDPGRVYGRFDRYSDCHQQPNEKNFRLTVTYYSLTQYGIRPEFILFQGIQGVDYAQTVKGEII